jgi:ParB-like chromosome segregation protein Spo0J
MSATGEVKLFPLRKLRRNARNPRTHSKNQVHQIARSINRFGWTQPIVIDKSGLILAGHGRYEAALLLKLRKVPVTILSGLTDTEKRALALADNKIAANADWDRRLLAQELGELAKLLPEISLDLEITGFEASEIEHLLGDFPTGQLDPADAVIPPQDKAVSRPGDRWQLGPHRLVCDHAQSLADVDAAVRRWQTYTRRDATLESTDQTFDQTAILRSTIGGER